MDPKHLIDARKLSKDAFKQATERFLARKRMESAPCTGVRIHVGHSPECPKAKETA